MMRGRLWAFIIWPDSTAFWPPLAKSASLEFRFVLSILSPDALPADRAPRQLARPLGAVEYRYGTRQAGHLGASEEGALATALPVTRLPSLASQEGPAKCLPKGLPLSSKSCASGAFSVQENC